MAKNACKMLQDLISNCGVSVEKLPLVVGSVLFLLFGNISESNYASTVKSHNTYALATERTALLVSIDIAKRFTDRESENRILYSYLILDASNKRGKGCVGKVVTYVSFDGIVRQMALRLDTTVTKKAVGSSKLTIESLQKEIGIGMVWIMGITTDAFGAAVEEAVIVLKHIDQLAMELYMTSPHLLQRQSKIVPGLTYTYGGKFRQACVRSCEMHNIERVLAHVLHSLMGSQGLSYDMTTAQSLYRMQYYWKKYKNMMDALVVQSLGGDMNKYNTADTEIRNLIGLVNATRWLSTERTCDNLRKALSVPASIQFIEYVRNSLGGCDSESWLTAESYCTCIDSNELSHIMLSFLYLANHCPEGKNRKVQLVV